MKGTLRGHDPFLTGAAALLTLIGLAFIFSAGYPRALAQEGSAIPGEFRSQLIVALISIAAFLTVASRPREFWRRAARPLAWIVFFLLIAVELKGHTQNGAKRWLGTPPLAIQPAEFAKLAVILAMAASLAKRVPWRRVRTRGIGQYLERVAAPKLERLGPLGILAIFFILIEREKDMGTGAVVAITGIVMFFLAGITVWSRVGLIALVLMGGAFFARKEPYRMERLMSHFSRWQADKVDDDGFQTTQAELAMASGGAVGVGVGNGRAKHIIPAATTDYILVTMAEETGLIGPLVALALVAAMVARLLWLARAARDRFASFALIGIGVWLTVQACTNMMMANATVPSIGIPFPFLSSGGSSLLALWLAVGIAQSLGTASVPAGEAVADRRHRWGNGRARLSGA